MSACRCAGCDKARKAERERIIKLLEEHAKFMESEYQDTSEVWGLEQGIALIKEENK